MRRFGTFEGVFLPTFLSILGVIMYLRLGWVVGMQGLKGAILIILISNCITLFTGLAISSIATNMKVGAGGAYAIISKSLGYHIGGAVGIPLYISQAVSVAFYITGFTECWVSVFPNTNFMLVSIIVWAVLLVVSYTSAKLAFRIQYFILIVIVLSLVSVFLGKSAAEFDPFKKGLETASFWKVFAVFFPAVTGILSGVSMSGELNEPEKNIPRGTLTAIAISFVVYAVLAYWFARHASSEELVENTSIIMDISRWRSLVVAGIMGATLSSALSMFVASSRTLLALSKNKVTPFPDFFSKVNKKGEPIPSILMTAFISIITLLLGTLNSIAEMLTMFFLITYGLLNLAVFIEQGIGIVSFRPSFRISIFFPAMGFAGCVFTMFLINPVFSILAIIIISGIYLALVQREVRRSWPDVRRGLFIFIAEKAIKTALNLPYHPKTWKPNLFIPVKNPKDWEDVSDFIKSIVYPSGRIYFLTVKYKNAKDSNIEKEMSKLEKNLKEKGILASGIIVEANELKEGIDLSLQSLMGSFFPPNILCIKIGSKKEKDTLLEEIINSEKKRNIGLMIFGFPEGKLIAKGKYVNLWLRDKSPNINLSILIALQIVRNWDGELRILRVVNEKENAMKAAHSLKRVVKAMRIPGDTSVEVIVGTFSEVIESAPTSDLNIFGMSSDTSIDYIRKMIEKTDTTVLFLKDSEFENAYA